jgi:hypothetical protein
VPYHFDFDPVHKILRCRFSGALSDEELRAYYREAGKRAELYRPAAGVMDFSDTQSVNVSRKAILELAEERPALPDPKTIRVIVAPAPVVFGMARMFEMVGERTRPNFHVVRNEKEAWAILGVMDAQFEELQGAPGT